MLSLLKVWAIALGLCWMILILLGIGYYRASAHDAIPTAAQPDGWSYPSNCCSNYDCRVINSSSKIKILETARGYVVVKPKGLEETLYYDDNRIKDSPDGEFHWCSVSGKDDTTTICLFAPPRGM